MKAALTLLAALVLASPAGAAIGDPAERLADPALEERAREIGRELRCLVCQNQSIEDSDAELARDLRRIVRERVATGADRDQVIRFVHDRYGDFVLLRPPLRGSTLLLWAMPFVAAGGGVLAILLLRRRRAVTMAEVTPLTGAEQRRLAQLEGRPRP